MYVHNNIGIPAVFDIHHSKFCKGALHSIALCNAKVDRYEVSNKTPQTRQQTRSARGQGMQRQCTWLRLIRCAQPVQYKEGGSKVRRLSPHALHMFSSVLSMGARWACPAVRQAHQMTHLASDVHFQAACIHSACGALLHATWVQVACGTQCCATSHARCCKM